jgi:predicted DNA-binding transcriptional regulator AlpA
MTHRPYSPTTLGLRLPDGRIVTACVESDQPPSKLAALRALHQAKRSLLGQRITTAKAASPPPDGLLTLRQAATKLGMSLRTLRQHVASGALRPINIGHGKQRQSLRFADSDINEFIAANRKDIPCPSARTETAARRISISTSKSKVIGFMEARNRRRDAKPTR